jgi:hypothetical protein
MSDVTRRELLQALAAAIASAGTFDAIAAREAYRAVQQAASASGGRYAPQALTGHEFRTLERLTDLIVPPEGSRPGALQCEVPAWIDALLNVNGELKERYTKGLAWLDAAMKPRAADFVSAPADEQTALLDRIAFQRNRSAELDPGIDFFILARRMTVDGFYTSPLGMRDVYPGNTPQAEFVVPQAAIDHVLGRSPLK